MDTDSVINRLGDIDVCFIIDSTASMGPFIDDAKRHAKQVAEDIATKGDLHLRLACVSYRDHPPQDHTYVSKTAEFGTLAHFQREIDTLVAYGGGDCPEAVYDGLYAAAGLQWREGADHLCYLIGDSPPHGVGMLGDGFPDGCPCGLTARGIIEVFSMHHITLHACAIGGLPQTVKEFGELASACHGELFKIDVHAPEMVTASFGATLTATSGSVTASRAVWAASANGASTINEYMAATGMSSAAIADSISYLSGRGYDVPLTWSDHTNANSTAASTADVTIPSPGDPAIITPSKSKHLRRDKSV